MLNRLCFLLFFIFGFVTIGIFTDLMPVAARPIRAESLSAVGRPSRRFSITSTLAAGPVGDINLSASPTFGPNPLQSPAAGATISESRPIFEWEDASGGSGAITYTLLITGDGDLGGLSTQDSSALITTTSSIYTPTQNLPNGVYTWTVQAHDSADSVSGFVAPYTFTLEAALHFTFLPVVQLSPQPACPTSSAAVFETIPIFGSVTNHPDFLHGDLNLSLRGYTETVAQMSLQDYNGPIDPDSPQLAGLFSPDQFPGISSVYRVNGWDWGCGAHGCPTGPVTDWAVTLMGFPTSPGQPITIPERAPDIYGGGYIAMVLYAEERRITFGYTRDDSVAPGYAVHIENVCVDPNLLNLYRAQNNADGWRVTGQLPALRNDQVLGTALAGEILVAIRDKGSFMDPRARQGWWFEYKAELE